MRRRTSWVVLWATAMFAAGGSLPATADEIIFLNGDRLTGTITSAAGGKVTIKTDAAGEVVVDMAKVRTFRTEQPVVVKIGDKTQLHSTLGAGPDGTVQAAPTPGGAPQTVAIKDIAQINPPPVQWTGSILANASITTGNTETTSIGLSAAASRRSEQDRITFGAGYYYGREKDEDTGQKDTTTDNWFVSGKYDYFFTPKFYGYAGVRIEQDKVADLNLRVTPSIGVGYQWFESPTFNLATEAGVAWVYEDYKGSGSDDHFAARLAYHVDYTPHPAVMLFHNLEWLPSFDSPIDDYNLNLDAGVRFTLVKNFFAEFKVDLRQDTTPAPGKDETDVRYLFSLGWRF